MDKINKIKKSNVNNNNNNNTPASPIQGFREWLKKNREWEKRQQQKVKI